MSAQPSHLAPPHPRRTCSPRRSPPPIREARCVREQFPEILCPIEPDDLLAGRIRPRLVGFTVDETGVDPRRIVDTLAPSARFPALEAVEFLPYHATGRDKAELVGLVNPLPGLPTTDDVTVSRWLHALHRLGCTRARRG